MTVVLVTLAATLLTQCGFLAWKAAANRMPALAGFRAHLGSALWWTGMSAAAGGWLLLVQAIALGEVGVVQPLMSLGDLLLVAASVVFFRERLARAEWLGVVLTLAGAGVLSGQARIVATRDVWWPGFALFFGALAVLGAVLLHRIRIRRTETPLALAVGIAFGSGALLTELMTAASGARSDWTGVLNPALPAVLAANAAGIVLLQAAFRHGRAAVVVPVQLSVINVVVVAGARMIFGEPATAPKVLGVALIAVGAGLLGRAGRPSEAPRACRT